MIRKLQKCFPERIHPSPLLDRRSKISSHNFGRKTVSSAPFFSAKETCFSSAQPDAARDNYTPDSLITRTGRMGVFVDPHHTWGFNRINRNGLILLSAGHLHTVRKHLDVYKSTRDIQPLCIDLLFITQFFVIQWNGTIKGQTQNIWGR